MFMFDFGGGGVVPTDIAFTKQKFAVAVADSLAHVLKVCWIVSRFDCEREDDKELGNGQWGSGGSRLRPTQLEDTFLHNGGRFAPMYQEIKHIASLELPSLKPT